MFLPGGFQVAGVHCGIKHHADREDLTLVVGEQNLVAAGVYTQNRIVAAPVLWDRRHTPADTVRVVVANSGNANACTGPRGDEDARQMARLAAEAVGAAEDQALVLSTGVIGHYLPMDRISAGIRAAAGQLGRDASALQQAARGILTTDRHAKLASRRMTLGSADCQLAGIAKGAGMIGPNMATLLAIIMTDAALTPDQAQSTLRQAVDGTFNCISVEGHTSTNDTVLLLASGQAGHPPLSAAEVTPFREGLTDLCTELARMIPSDGEGASHLVTIDVEGCASVADARRIAEAVANSALVKTAIAGNDPNWGRIISAAGYAGVPFAPDQLELQLNGTVLYHGGAPAEFEVAAVSRAMRAEHETRIRLRLAGGTAGCRFWTSDLTAEYVRINSEYHT